MEKIRPKQKKVFRPGKIAAAGVRYAFVLAMMAFTLYPVIYTLVGSFKTNAAYAGAKTALATLARSTAVCYARYGITCNVILPGFTQTEYISESEQKKHAEKMPLHKLVETENIAEAAVFLLRQPMINGAMLNVDGGWEP